MIKIEKINWIKAWLQRFGDRDNETYNITVEVDDDAWNISLQYNFDFEGNQLTPFNWCQKSFKQRDNTLGDRTEDELSGIIKELTAKGTVI